MTDRLTDLVGTHGQIRVSGELEKLTDPGTGDPPARAPEPEGPMISTTGPWTCRRRRGASDSWWVLAPPSRPHHAGYVAECVANGAQNEANARLIAAAPDLYEALFDLLTVIAQDELIPESVSYMREARAAIAKVEGKP